MNKEKFSELNILHKKKKQDKLNIFLKKLN
jgi:hypothetical protein